MKIESFVELVSNSFSPFVVLSSFPVQKIVLLVLFVHAQMDNCHLGRKKFHFFEMVTEHLKVLLSSYDVIFLLMFQPIIIIS